MTKLSESLANLEKNGSVESVQNAPNPSKFVYTSPSGTKDIHVKMQIGGRSFTQKKVYRNPKPVFGMSDGSFENKQHATSGKLDHKTVVQSASGVVNISVVPKIFNTDVKGEKANTEIVYGLHKLGGAGTRFAEDMVEKIEELKLLKQETMVELQFKQFEKANPMKSTRHGKSHGSGL